MRLFKHSEVGTGAATAAGAGGVAVDGTKVDKVLELALVILLFLLLELAARQSQT